MSPRTRPFLTGFSTGRAAILATLALGSAAVAAPVPPNILVIITDQQSADAMSCRIGHRFINTPNMDSLAAHGVFFTRAYSSNPICVPSRTSMFTGRFPCETGVQSNERVPFDPRAFPTLGTYFQRAGYDTGYVGKWHMFIPIDNPALSGFDYAANIQNGGGDAKTPAGVADFLGRKRDRPFLLVASFVNPHNIAEWSRGQPLPEGDIGPPPPPEECPPAPANLAPTAGESDTIAYVRKSYQSTWVFPVGRFDAARWRQYRWAYYRLVERSDALIGQVLASLAASGHADDTVIVFTADHGDAQGAHGWSQKTVFYEESVRVPFIVSAPGVKRALTSDRFVQTGPDLIPTLCDFAGIPKPPALPGLSLRATALGETEPDPRRYVVASNHFMEGIPILGIWRKPAGRMLRSERYKYCVYDQGHDRESLYDLDKDPGELTNLAGVSADQTILNEHRAMLLDWAHAHHDAEFPFIAPVNSAN